MHRLDRLLAILLFVQSRRVTRAEDIAAKFNITVRTAYRDLGTLGEAGVPLVAQGGVGYSILKNFHLQPVTFTPDEAAAVAIGGVLVQQFAGSAYTEHMSSALLKISAVLPPQLRDHMDILEQSIRPLRKLDAVPSPRGRGQGEGQTSSSAVPADNLLPIQDALAKRHILRFRYQGAGKTDTTAREVEPMALIFYLQRWHLFAWDRSKLDYRDFRTDRIRNLEVTTAKFAPRKGFKLEDHLERLLNPRHIVTARVRATHLAAERLRREAFLGVSDEQVGEGGTTVTLRAANRDWLINWLLSFGTAVSVISPADIRQRLAETATQAARHHSVAP